MSLSDEHLAAMTPQTCPAGLHADWAVDSEHDHACPWCRIAELENELAEVKAGHDPRLRCLIVKAARDRDLYIGWSNVAEAPAGMWTRAEALAYGFPSSRLDRADKNGSSDISGINDGWWDDPDFIAEQRGTLRRDRLADYARHHLNGEYDAAFDLLEPFDGETEVRRG